MKAPSFEDLAPTRNRAAAARHRRETRAQITAPVVLFALVLLGLGGFLSVSAVGGSPSGPWRDLALIWLLLLSMLAALIPFAILAAIAYGLIRLIALLPEWTYRLQRLVDRVAGAAAAFSRSITAPAVRIGSLTAGLRELIAGATGSRSKR